MIRYLDRFVDTREKRFYLIVILAFISWGLFAFYNILCAKSILEIDNYQQLFSSTQNPAISYSIIARIVLDAMSLPSFDFMRVISIVLSNIHVIEISLIITTCLAYGHKRNYDRHQKCLRVFLYMIILALLLMIIFVLMGLNAGSLNDALSNIHKIGWTIMIVSLIQMILVFIHLYQLIGIDYKEALKIEVIEIED